MRVKLSKRDIGYFIMLLSIFKFSYVPNAWIMALYRSVQLISLLYLLAETYVTKLSNGKLILLFCLYYLILGISTLINEGSYTELIEETLMAMLTVLWMHQMVGRDPRHCLAMLFIAFEIIIYANLISLFLYPKGLYRTADSIVSARYGWLLGHQSLFCMYAAPAICVASMFFVSSNKISFKIRAVLLAITCVMQTIYMGSATNIVCLLVILFGSLGMLILHMKKFPFKLLYIFVAVVAIIIVIFQNVGFTKQFVVDYLHRTETFTGRTSIWTQALKLIKGKLFFGYGAQDDETVISLLKTVHAHNQYLQCTYLGGMPLLIVFLIICFRSFRNVQPYVYSFPGKVMTSAIASLLIQMMFEAYFHHPAGKYLFLLSFYFPQLYTGFSSANIKGGKWNGKL